ncbi:MAG: hypothetical protein NVS3B21_22620 [Acidimicrobiales bacterium]
MELPASDRATAREEASVAPREHRTVTGDEAIASARHRFGGLDTGATISGAFAALGLTVLLGGVLAGAGRVVYVNGLRDAPAATTGSVIAGLAVLLVAFLVGGWVAGRMARYDGGRNGMVTAVWFVLFAAGTSATGALLGQSYNVFSGDRLPQWFTDSARTPEAVLSAAVAFLVMVGAGFVGGLVGGRYHRRVDRLVAGLTPVAVDGGSDGRRVQGRRPGHAHRRGNDERRRQDTYGSVSGPAVSDVDHEASPRGEDSRGLGSGGRRAGWLRKR